MYLKKRPKPRLKSFAIRQKVVFDKGVTAVVGPNGLEIQYGELALALGDP